MLHINNLAPIVPLYSPLVVHTLVAPATSVSILQNMSSIVNKIMVIMYYRLPLDIGLLHVHFLFSLFQVQYYDTVYTRTSVCEIRVKS